MKLHIYNLYWLPHLAEEHDLCAHGAVDVQIGGEMLAEGADSCVSAGALFLLRSLTADYMPTDPTVQQLIPCCGHTMYAISDGQAVEIGNCNVGVDWQVRHQAGLVVLRTHSGVEESMPAAEWEQIVFAFADTVAAFYARSLPKVPKYDHEAAPFAAFQAEWSRLRGRLFVGAKMPQE